MSRGRPQVFLRNRTVNDEGEAAVVAVRFVVTAEASVRVCRKYTDLLIRIFVMSCETKLKSSILCSVDDV